MIPTEAIRLRATGVACRRPGFTLIELMIALALVLLLVLAISQIFNVTTKAIGKGQATGEVVRGLDAARVALQIDFTGTDNIAYLGFGDKSGILPTNRQPAIIISSTSIPAFVSQRDMDADNDYDVNEPNPLVRAAQIATVDSNNDGIDDLDLTPYQLGARWFRTDSLSFFARGEFESQTNLQPSGATTQPSFYGNTTSREAWVWYGHGLVYDGSGVLNDAGSYFLPAEGSPATNPNNFFASQFVLLRTPILLKAQYDHDRNIPTPTASTLTTDDGSAPILFLRPVWDPLSPANPSPGTEPEVGPLSYLTQVRSFLQGAPDDHQTEPPAPATDVYEIQDSRVDVAGVTASQYRQRLTVAQGFAGAGPNQHANGPLRFDTSAPRAANPPTWYNRLFARSNGNAQNQNPARFWINPLVLKPLNAGEVSQASNYLLGGASQFIVEYAGDFQTQRLVVVNPGEVVGDVIANQPDGVVDFTIDANAVRHIRWYGMPRDVDGDGVIAGPGATVAARDASIDVRPLADYVTTGGNMTVDSGFPFEKRLPGEYSGNPEAVSGRANIVDYGEAYRNGEITDWTYLVAWGPNDFDGGLYGTMLGFGAPPGHNDPALDNQALRPSLIRVIISGIDSRSKLENAISQELVFRVPHE